MFDPHHRIKTELGDVYGPRIGCRLEAWNSESQGHTQLHVEFKNSLIYRRHFLKTKKKKKQLWALFLFLLGLKQATTFSFSHLPRFGVVVWAPLSMVLLVGFIYCFLNMLSHFLLDHITYDTNYQLYLYMNFKVSHLVISVWALSVTCRRYMQLTWKSLHVLLVYNCFFYKKISFSWFL